MEFLVLDRRGNCLAQTSREGIARRLVRDNLERGYRLIRDSGRSLIPQNKLYRDQSS